MASLAPHLKLYFGATRVADTLAFFAVVWILQTVLVGRRRQFSRESTHRRHASCLARTTARTAPRSAESSLAQAPARAARQSTVWRWTTSSQSWRLRRAAAAPNQPKQKPSWNDAVEAVRSAYGGKRNLAVRRPRRGTSLASAAAGLLLSNPPKRTRGRRRSRRRPNLRKPTRSPGAEPTRPAHESRRRRGRPCRRDPIARRVAIEAAASSSTPAARHRRRRTPAGCAPARLRGHAPLTGGRRRGLRAVFLSLARVRLVSLFLEDTVNAKGRARRPAAARAGGGPRRPRLPRPRLFRSYRSRRRRCA